MCSIFSVVWFFITACSPSKDAEKSPTNILLKLNVQIILLQIQFVLLQNEFVEKSQKRHLFTEYLPFWVTVLQCSNKTTNFWQNDKRLDQFFKIILIFNFPDHVKEEEVDLTELRYQKLVKSPPWWQKKPPKLTPTTNRGPGSCWRKNSLDAGIC